MSALPSPLRGKRSETFGRRAWPRRGVRPPSVPSGPCLRVTRVSVTDSLPCRLACRGRSPCRGGLGGDGSLLAAGHAASRPRLNELPLASRNPGSPERGGLFAPAHWTHRAGAGRPAPAGSSVSASRRPRSSRPFRPTPFRCPCPVHFGAQSHREPRIARSRRRSPCCGPLPSSFSCCGRSAS